MAHSPVTGAAVKKKLVKRASISRNRIERQRGRRAPRRQIRHPPQFNRLCQALYQHSRHFRLGYHVGIHRWSKYGGRESQVQIRIVERDRVDFSTKLKLDEALRNNATIIRDNARLKVERLSLLSDLSKAMNLQLDLYYKNTEYEDLKKKYADLLNSFQKAVGKKKINKEFFDLMPEFEALAEQDGAAQPDKMTFPCRKPWVNKTTMLHYPSLDAIGEEALSRTRSAGDGVAGDWNDDQAGRGFRRRRHTALPNELRRLSQLGGLVTPEKNQPSNSPATTRNSLTPRLRPPNPGLVTLKVSSSEKMSPESLANGPRRSTTLRDRQDENEVTPEKSEDHEDKTHTTFRISPPSDHSKTAIIDATSGNKKLPVIGALPAMADLTLLDVSPLPVAAAKSGKRSHSSLLIAESQLCRKSLGVSPRPNTRQNGRHSLAQDSITDNTSKRLCFVPEPEEASGSDEAESSQDWESVLTGRDSYGSLSDNGCSTSTLSSVSRRPSRAAKDKIVSFKEPSLNTKMRRPADVAPLTPGQDRKGKKPHKSTVVKIKKENEPN